MKNPNSNGARAALHFSRQNLGVCGLVLLGWLTLASKAPGPTARTRQALDTDDFGAGVVYLPPSGADHPARVAVSGRTMVSGEDGWRRDGGVHFYDANELTYDGTLLRKHKIAEGDGALLYQPRGEGKIGGHLWICMEKNAETGTGGVMRLTYPELEERAWFPSRLERWDRVDLRIDRTKEGVGQVILRAYCSVNPSSESEPDASKALPRIPFDCALGDEPSQFVESWKAHTLRLAGGGVIRLLRFGIELVPGEGKPIQWIHDGGKIHDVLLTEDYDGDGVGEIAVVSDEMWGREEEGIRLELLSGKTLQTVRELPRLECSYRPSVRLLSYPDLSGDGRRELLLSSSFLIFAPSPCEFILLWDPATGNILHEVKKTRSGPDLFEPRFGFGLCFGESTPGKNSIWISSLRHPLMWPGQGPLARWELGSDQLNAMVTRPEVLRSPSFNEPDEG